MRTSPRTRADRMTEKKGSRALMVCVNETATFPRLMLVKALPKVCTMARGRMAMSCRGTTQAQAIGQSHFTTTERTLHSRQDCIGYVSTIL